MSKYYVPVEIEGKWWVVENAPDKPPAHIEKPVGVNITVYDGLLAACTKYPTLESDRAYWKSKAGVKMGEGEFNLELVKAKWLIT